MKISQLYLEIGNDIIVFTNDDHVEFEEINKFTIDDLDAIVIEAKAFREYRKSRMPVVQEAAKSKCKQQVITKEMLISQLESKEVNTDKDNNISEVIYINGGELISPTETTDTVPTTTHDTTTAFQVLNEVPAFTTTTVCTHYTCNKSSYCITRDGRIKIDPPAPYTVYIYTTVAEIVRLRSMSAAELRSFYPAYEKQTYANKRYTLRLFLLDIKDEVFPPATVDAVEPAQEPEHTHDEADTPEVLPTDPYVLKTRMSKKTAALWDKFAGPSKVKP